MKKESESKSSIHVEPIYQCWFTWASLLVLITCFNTAIQGQTPFLTYGHPVDITTDIPVFEETLDVSTQTTIVNDVLFNPDGTKMFVVGNNGIFQYSVAIPYDLSETTPDNVSILTTNIPAASGIMTGMTFGQDGNFLFLSFTGQRVVKLGLNSPYNLSSFTQQETMDVNEVITAESVAMSFDGKKLFVLDGFNNRIQTYNLTLPFNITTGVNASPITFSVANEESSPAGMFFFSAGTQMMVVGTNGDEVNQYSLGNVAYRISTGVTFDGSPFNINSTESSPRGIFISPQGTKMFVGGNNGIHSFKLSSSEVFTESSVNDGTIEGTMQISQEGTLFSSLPNSHYTIHNLPEGLAPSISVSGGHGKTAILSFIGQAISNGNSADISSLRFTYTDDAFTTLNASNVENAISANSGLGINFQGNPGLRYSAPVDIVANSPQFNGPPLSIDPEEEYAQGLVFSTDGTKLFIIGSKFLGQGTAEINQYTLTTPFDLTSGMSFDGNPFDISNFTISPTDLLFDPSGTRLFVLGEDEATIFQFRLSEPYDITTGVAYNGISVDIRVNDTQPTGMVFNNSGKALYIIGKEHNEIVRYSVPNNEYDLSNGLAVSQISSFVASEVSKPEGLVFDPTGTRLLIIDSSADDISQFSLTNGFSLLSSTYNGRFSISAQEGVPTGLTLNSNGTKLYVTGFVGDDINQYTLADTQVFKETPANDGSVEGEMKIRLANDQFSISGVLSPSSYSINNLPFGLSPSVFANAGTATLSLSGNVDFSAHNDDIADDISDLQFTFSDAVFVSGDASKMEGTTNASSGLGIDFDENIAVDQTITFSSLSPVTYGGDFALTATTSSGLTLSYTSSDLSVATVNGSSVTIIGTGTTSITASQAGDNQYNPATDVIQDLVVDKATLTAIADVKSKTYGDANPSFPVSYTGFVNGEVSSVLDILPSAGTSASSSSDVGTYDITVSGGTDDNYSYSYVSGTLTINRASLMVFADDQTKVFGDPLPEFTFSYGGFVNDDDENSIDILPTVAILATENSNVGIYDIDLVGGSDNNYTYVHVSGTLEILKANQVITISSIENVGVTTAAFPITASVDSGLELDYEVSGPATLSGTTIILDGTVGTVTVTVSQAGTENFNSASKQITFNVNDLQNQTITFENLADRTFGDMDFELTASASSELPVTYSVVSGPISVNGATISINGVGDATIAAEQNGNTNYNAASKVTQSFSIAKADQEITIEPIPDKLTSDDPFAISATTDSGLDLTYKVDGPAEIDALTITLTGQAGTATLTVTQVGNENYNPVEGIIKFEITEEMALTVVDDLISIRFYPNPASEFLIIDSAEPISARLFDLHGKLITQDLSESGRIDIQNVLPGVYILEIKTDQNILQKRIVKAN
ncbi:MAG: MBG domain-containing protein [Cyclobacteriaceae bacterium]